MPANCRHFNLYLPGILNQRLQYGLFLAPLFSHIKIKC